MRAEPIDRTQTDPQLSALHEGRGRGRGRTMGLGRRLVQREQIEAVDPREGRMIRLAQPPYLPPRVAGPALAIEVRGRPAEQDSRAVQPVQDLGGGRDERGPRGEDNGPVCSCGRRCGLPGLRPGSALYVKEERSVRL